MPARGTRPLSSDDTTTDQRDRRWTPLQITRTVALAALVVVLVGGAALIAGTGGSVDDPGAYVAALYDEADVEGALDVIPDAARDGVSREEFGGQLEQVLRQGVEVTDVTDAVDVAGVPVTPVRTSDGAVWCVGPSGTLTPGCFVAVASVDVSADRLTSPLSDVQVFLGSPPAIRLVLENTGDEPVSVGPLSLSSADGQAFPAQLVQANLFQQGSQPAVADPEGEDIPPGGALVMVWTVDDEPYGRTLRVGGEDGVDLTVARPRYLHR